MAVEVVIGIEHAAVHGVIGAVAIEVFDEDLLGDQKVMEVSEGAVPFASLGSVKEPEFVLECFGIGLHAIGDVEGVGKNLFDRGAGVFEEILAGPPVAADAEVVAGEQVVHEVEVVVDLLDGLLAALFGVEDIGEFFDAVIEAPLVGCLLVTLGRGGGALG